MRSIGALKRAVAVRRRTPEPEVLDVATVDDTEPVDLSDAHDVDDRIDPSTFPSCHDQHDERVV